MLKWYCIQYFAIMCVTQWFLIRLPIDNNISVTKFPIHNTIILIIHCLNRIHIPMKTIFVRIKFDNL